MSTHSSEPGAEEPEENSGQDKEAAGAEIGITDGEGSTFEPEEDAEGHGG